MGLEPIDTAGKTFDPNLHQAVERVYPPRKRKTRPCWASSSEAIISKESCLRPAMVKVAVRP